MTAIQAGRPSNVAAPFLQDRGTRQLALEEERKGCIVQPVAQDREVRLGVVSLHAGKHVEVRRADDAKQPALLVHERDGAGGVVEAGDDDRARAQRGANREQLVGSRIEPRLELTLLERQGGQDAEPRTPAQEPAAAGRFRQVRRAIRFPGQHGASLDRSNA
jgi:hypothetical protein